jgi:hypothetical protein
MGLLHGPAVVNGHKKTMAQLRRLAAGSGIPGDSADRQNQRHRAADRMVEVFAEEAGRIDQEFPDAFMLAVAMVLSNLPQFARHDCMLKVLDMAAIFGRAREEDEGANG